MLSQFPFKTWFALLCGAGLGLAGCAEPCTGSIECTVLYAKPGPKSVGRFIYANVLNKPDLGIKTTLMYEGKEFGRFDHVVIISDPENRFATNRQICFTTYHAVPTPADGQLEEANIPRIQLDK